MHDRTTVPATLTNELVARLGRLSGQPASVAEVALSALSYGSLASLLAHGIVSDVDLDGDVANELAVTPYGWEVIGACADAAASSASPLSPGTVERLGRLAGLNDDIAATALSAAPYEVLRELDEHGAIHAVRLDGDEAAEIVLTERGRELIEICAAAQLDGGDAARMGSTTVTLTELTRLLGDGRSVPLQIGTVARFDGPAPPFDEVLAHVDARLALVPRCRQKLAGPLAWATPTWWTEDADFDARRHVRWTQLPAPGGERELQDVVSAIFAEPLDRDRPLWELWVVGGLSADGFALVWKCHFALADDLTGVEMLTTLYDLTPEPIAGGPGPGPSAAADASTLDLAATAVGDALRTAVRVSFRVGSNLLPWHALSTARDVVESVGHVAWASLHPKPRSPLNGPVGPNRQVAFADVSLADFRAVKQGLGGSVNDAVLASVAGGLRAYLLERGHDVDELPLRAVAVTTRGVRDEGAFVGRLTQLLTPLPVDVENPVERHRTIVSSTEAAHPSLAEDRPNALEQVLRLSLATRVANVMIANVAGSPLPLFFLGRRMHSLHPIPFLTADHELAVGAMSYDGRVHVTLIGDPDAVPDVESIAPALRAGLDELLAAARGIGMRGSEVLRLHVP